MQALRLNFTINKTLLVNITSFGVIQLTNFLLPLFLYPYLFRTVGIEKLGTISYALNIMLYLSTIIDYGYNIAAPRRVVLNRNNDKKNLADIVSKIYSTKVLLFSICFILLTLYILININDKSDITLYMLGNVYLLGICLLPTWLFQGLESMSFFTIVNLVAKLLSIIFIIYAVNSPDDYKYVLGILGSANLVSSIISIIYVSKKRKLTIKIVTLTYTLIEIKDNFYFFITSFTSVIFSNSTIFLLGIYVSKNDIGEYSLAEKIAFAGWQLVIIFSQATYPLICRMVVKSKAAVKRTIFAIYVPFISIVFIICLLIHQFSELIVHTFTKQEELSIIQIVKTLAFVPFIISLNVPANHLLLAYGHEKTAAIVINVVTLFSIITTTASILNFGVKGGAWSVVLAQILLSLGLNIAAWFKSRPNEVA